MYKVRFTGDSINFYDSEFECLEDAQKFAQEQTAEGFRDQSGAVLYEKQKQKYAPIGVYINVSGKVKWYDN